MENQRPNQLRNLARENHVSRSQIVHNPGYITKLAPWKRSLISTNKVKPVLNENQGIISVPRYMLASLLVRIC